MTELRTPTISDLGNLARWATDPDLLKLDPPAGACVDPLYWSIYAGETHIGLATVYNRDEDDIELGIRIGNKAFWGKQHGERAVKLVLDYCRSIGVKRVHLKVLPTNVRAIRCYKRCGFTETRSFILDGIEFTGMERSIA